MIRRLDELNVFVTIRFDSKKLQLARSSLESLLNDLGETPVYSVFEQKGIDQFSMGSNPHIHFVALDVGWVPFTDALAKHFERMGFGDVQVQIVDEFRASDLILRFLMLGRKKGRSEAEIRTTQVWRDVNDLPHPLATNKVLQKLSPNPGDLSLIQMRTKQYSGSRF